MKNNDAGEFELVLGNRQLLSGFFVVVILFAVFFVMGFIVGRNSTPPPKIAAASEVSNVGAPAPQTRPSASASFSPPPATERPADSQPQPTQAAHEPAAKTPPPPPATVAVTPTETTPGETYLQVMAVKQEEAEVVARTLTAKGFPASLAPGLRGLTRVMVGPYSDTASLGKAKADLENSGFHPIVKR